VRLRNGLLPGDATDPLALGLEQGLAFSVFGAGDLVVVPCSAVGFHDESPVGPSEVRDHTTASDTQRHVHVGAFQPGIEEQVEHNVLELASSWRRARGNIHRSFVIPRRRLERPSAATIWATFTSFRD
jgi:hypothetical protein